MFDPPEPIDDIEGYNKWLEEGKMTPNEMFRGFKFGIGFLSALGWVIMCIFIVVFLLNKLIY
jgi:hypothetical protein